MNLTSYICQYGYSFPGPDGEYCHAETARILIAENVALNNRLNATDEANDLMRDALDHIAKTCTQSRTQTLRLRWIMTRANLAVQGKPYIEAEHDLPRSAGDSAVKAEAKVRHFKHDNEQLKAKIIDCRGLLALLVQNTHDGVTQYTPEIRRVLSSLQE